MAKPKDTPKDPKDSGGTPTSIILSVLAAIVLFGVEEIKASVALADAFALRSVLLANIGLGLALCFFWRRLPQNAFRVTAAGTFFFGLWFTLLITAIGPYLRPNSILPAAVFQQIALGAVVLSGLFLMVGFLIQEKRMPGVIASALGGLSLVALSGVSFLKVSHPQHEGEEVLAAGGHGHESAGGHADEHGSEHGASADEHHAAGDEHHAGASAHPAGDAHHAAAGDDHHAVAGDDHHASKGPKPGPAPKKKKQGLAAKSLHGDEEEGHKTLAHMPQGDEMAPLHRVSADDRTDHDDRVLQPSHRKSAKDKKASHGAGDVHWSYEGAGSPQRWAELSPDNKLCSLGKQQSPINISASWPLLQDVSVDYKLDGLKVTDNGHTLVFAPQSANKATIAGRDWKLLQFHIHAPSEHTIGGKSAAMEIHFVHQDAQGQLAVLGVMVDEGKEGIKAFDEMMGFIPRGIDKPISPKGKLFNFASLLPKSLKVYRYKGSLTTPPCSENVLWSVAAERVTMSAKQIQAFKDHYKNNARPIQYNQAH